MVGVLFWEIVSPKFPKKPNFLFARAYGARDNAYKINILPEGAQKHKRSWAVRLAQCGVFYRPWYLWGIIYILIDHFPTKRELTSPKKRRALHYASGFFSRRWKPIQPNFVMYQPEVFNGSQTRITFSSEHNMSKK